MSIVLGIQRYSGPSDAQRRLEQAIDALTRLEGVVPVNVQWPDDVSEHQALETLPVLRKDSRTVSGIPGRRKPIAPEMFDALADVARARGLRYFGYLNADIVVTPSAIDVIRSRQKQTYVFSRMDVDPHGGALEIVDSGLDLFVFETAWWTEHRRRFRPYILGEYCFDNIYASIMMCHGDGLICNRDGEIRHERHPHGAVTGFGDYNWYLASLDSRYFSLWAQYWTRLRQLRERGGSEADERSIQREVFVWRPSFTSRFVHIARSVKAYRRYRRQRARWMSQVEARA